MPSRQRFGRQLRTIALTLLPVVLLASTAQAEERDWYDVEIVIFRQHDGGNVQSAERWPLMPEPPLFERYARVGGEVVASGSDADPMMFRQLPEDVLGLRDTVRRLRQDAAYEVLVHAAWRQPGLPGDEAPAVYIPLDAEPPEPMSATPGSESSDMDDDTRRGEAATDSVEPIPSDKVMPPLPEGLSGHVRLIRERYLHFEADLRFKDAPEREAVDEAMQGVIPLFRSDAQPVVVMDQRRRMRSGELHYLDNPRLGVLVEARVAEGPEQEGQ